MKHKIIFKIPDKQSAKIKVIFTLLAPASVSLIRTHPFDHIKLKLCFRAIINWNSIISD